MPEPAEPPDVATPLAELAGEADVVYHGYHRAAGGSVITVETVGGDPMGVLRHVPKHSPTGMSWGYAGSGPADTARSLLIAAVGEEQARCPVCRGTRRTVFDVDGGRELPYDPAVGDDDPELVMSCTACDDGYRQLPYQRFKFEFVAGWGTEWTMSRAAILDWLGRAGC